MMFNIKIQEVNQHAKLTANEIIPLSYLKDDEKKAAYVLLKFI